MSAKKYSGGNKPFVMSYNAANTTVWVTRVLSPSRLVECPTKHFYREAVNRGLNVVDDAVWTSIEFLLGVCLYKASPLGTNEQGDQTWDNVMQPKTRKFSRGGDSLSAATTDRKHRNASVSTSQR